MQCMVCLDSSMIILGHHFVAILLAKMLIWAPFSQLMCTFSFCINPWAHTLESSFRTKIGSGLLRPADSWKDTSLKLVTG